VLYTSSINVIIFVVLIIFEHARFVGSKINDRRVIRDQSACHVKVVDRHNRAMTSAAAPSTALVKQEVTTSPETARRWSRVRNVLLQSATRATLLQPPDQVGI